MTAPLSPTPTGPRRRLVVWGLVVGLAIAATMGCGAADVERQPELGPVASELVALSSQKSPAPPATSSSLMPEAVEPVHASVPPSVPTAVAVPGLGISAPVEEYTDAMVEAADGWVDPPRRDTVAWWSGGGTPADPADNTVYLYGHVSRLPAAFNGLTEAELGDEVILTTEAGTLTYNVTEVLPPIVKEELPNTAAVTDAVPGRLVLIGCHREPDQGIRPTTRNTVVIAELSTSAVE